MGCKMTWLGSSYASAQSDQGLRRVHKWFANKTLLSAQQRFGWDCVDAQADCADLQADRSLISIKPAHEMMALFVLRKRILQTCMCSHPVVLDFCFMLGTFVYFHTSWVRTVKALARLRGCAGPPAPLLVAYVISTIISWAGSIYRF